MYQILNISPAANPLGLACEFAVSGRKLKAQNHDMIEYRLRSYSALKEGK
jgi:hypothetical protein